MFIEELKIENFKGYHGSTTIKFKAPDGVNEGSGLNIFVGENNSGKSTVFETLALIKDGTNKDTECLLSKVDQTNMPKSYSVEAVFSGDVLDVVRTFAQSNKASILEEHVYHEDGLDKLKVRRCSDFIRKIYFWHSEKGFSTPTGIDAPFKKLYESNFIWADTNPNDEAKFGSSTICGSLLREIAAEHSSSVEYRDFQRSFHALFNNPNSELRQKIADIEDQVKDVLSSQFGNADVSFAFNELQIDNFFKTATIMIDDGISVSMSEKGHGMQRALALALIQVYAEITANKESNDRAKPFFLFIDEPEICLHPSGQIKLLDALMKISKHKQVFIATHSPFMLSSSKIKNAGIFIFKKNNLCNYISPVDTTPTFPWSPTWGEISYKAYNLPTVDFHNELYGYLQDLSLGHRQTTFDQWLNKLDIQSSKQWTRESNGVAGKTENVTLQTFIRNHIHHPENRTMRAKTYSPQELKRSIEDMFRVLPVAQQQAEAREQAKAREQAEAHV